MLSAWWPSHLFIYRVVKERAFGLGEPGLRRFAICLLRTAVNSSGVNEQ